MSPNFSSYKTDDNRLKSPRMGSRTPSGGNYEESYETLTEEGDPNGCKIIQHDKITVRHKVEEIFRPRSRGSRTFSEEVLDRNFRTPSREELRVFRAHEHNLPSVNRVPSRTPSEEHIDSSYFTQNGSLSKSSSQHSLDNFRRSLSREALDWDASSVASGTSSRGSEWYNEYRHQSFQNFNSKLERVLTRQEYDTHISEIKGKRRFSMKKIG